MIGEAKWTSRPIGTDLLDNLLTHKIPALAAAGLNVQPRPAIVLASRNGFAHDLLRRADADPDLHLVDASALLMELRDAPE